MVVFSVGCSWLLVGCLLVVGYLNYLLLVGLLLPLSLGGGEAEQETAQEAGSSQRPPV